MDTWGRCIDIQQQQLTTLHSLKLHSMVKLGRWRMVLLGWEVLIVSFNLYLYTTFMIQKLLSWTVKGIQTNGKMDWLRAELVCNHQPPTTMADECGTIPVGSVTQLIANRVSHQSIVIPDIIELDELSVWGSATSTSWGLSNLVPTEPNRTSVNLN